jgi:hypothetical protein
MVCRITVHGCAVSDVRRVCDRDVYTFGLFRSSRKEGVSCRGLEVVHLNHVPCEAHSLILCMKDIVALGVITPMSSTESHRNKSKMYDQYIFFISLTHLPTHASSSVSEVEEGVSRLIGVRSRRPHTDDSGNGDV